ncbi:hypothetical protein P8452_40450 [Trifolium repens]|nr:hypothetical protein P8452_40450 [Trifolium repens]
MEENPKLELSSSSSCSYYGCGDHGFEMEQKGIMTSSVSDNVNCCSSYQYTTEKADSYVIDMDAFSSSINKDSSNQNSRITVQRSLSRKGSQRVGDRKINGLTTLQIHDNKDVLSAMCSPIATLSGACTPILPATMAVVSADHSINPHAHQQSNIGGTTTSTTTTGSLTRRNSFIRSSSWTIDPKRVLIFFATLSSMGTMLLIYFTLVSNKQNVDEYVGDIGSSE